MKKIILKKYAQLIFIIIVSGLILLFSDSTNIIIHIGSILVLSFGAIYIVKFDLLHPYFWYSTIFTLYSISYPILYSANIITRFGYNKQLIILQWLALTVFLLVFSPLSNITMNKDKKYIDIKLNKYVINFIWCFLLIATLLISRAGYTSKKDIYASGNIFVNFAFSLATLFTIIYMYNLIYKLISKAKIDVLLVIKVWSAIILLTLFSGERDLLFRLIVVTVFILYLFNKIKNRHIVLAIPFVIIALPLSHSFKYFFLSGQINELNILDFKSLIYEFLNGEFVSASKNLQVILNNSQITEGYFGGRTIINDFVRIFFETDFSHGRWFMQSFFPHTTHTEYGFTLVGQGYINFGYLGVILIFALLALFLRILYKNASKNIFYMIMYLYSVPLFMYAIRADIANIFSPFIKYLLLGIIFMYILGVIQCKKTKN